ncbi:MAG: RagB/SusD family nutrient uptake outer membrane protein, partial [Bacteroidales bacterium]|nr:RagB/SusD family nutrient uptake outer membrane protein [Bacteroidales bacterium]
GTDGKTKAYEHTLMKFTRDIDDHFYLRPIPLSQLNNMEMTDEEKAAYQNPGY